MLAKKIRKLFSNKVVQKYSKTTTVDFPAKFDFFE